MHAYWIDPMIAWLAGVGLLATLAWAVRAGQALVTWWRWRRMVRRGFRPEVA